MVKRSLAIMAMLASAGSASAQYDVEITGMNTPNDINNGGEFRWGVNSTANDGDQVQTGLTGAPGNAFDSFCVELNETVSRTGTYFGVINTAAWNGGLGGGNPDPLSTQTAWLFSQFSAGTLADYEYEEGAAGNGSAGDNSVLSRAETARALQLAIWVLEEEINNVTDQGGVAGSNDTDVYDLANDFIDLANANAISGLYSVRVLNMYDNSDLTGNRQDMLVMIPLPQAGALACVGLAGLAVRRRRTMA